MNMKKLREKFEDILFFFCWKVKDNKLKINWPLAPPFTIQGTNLPLVDPTWSHYSSLSKSVKCGTCGRHPNVLNIGKVFRFFLFWSSKSSIVHMRKCQEIDDDFRQTRNELRQQSLEVVKGQTSNTITHEEQGILSVQVIF